MKIEIDVRNVEVLVGILLSEVEMLKDFLEDSELTLDRQNQLIAEKTEIIKHLGQQIKAAPKKRGRPKKVTDVTSPVKRKPGRPKGSKKGKIK